MTSSSMAAVGPSQRLKAKLHLIGGPLRTRLAAFWSDGRFRELYPKLLRELFVVSRGGIPLMEAVRDEALRREDRASRLLAAYLHKHVAEERGHCEWVLDDLAVLGFDRVEEARRPLTFHASSLLGCAYTWSFEVHPAAILGFLAVFEGDPMTVPFLEAVIARQGLPKEAFGFYLDHARIDPQHSADIHALIDEVATDPALEEAITLCAMHALHLTDGILRAIHDPAEA
jgi:hypothetical protein